MKNFIEIILTLTVLIILILNSCSPKLNKMSQSELSKYPIDTSGVVYEFFDTDIKLVIINKIAPKYPEKAKIDGVQGVVVVETIISPEGKAKAVGVKESIHPALDEEAKRTVEKCEFQPAIKNGKKVACKLMIPFAFKLK